MQFGGQQGPTSPFTLSPSMPMSSGGWGFLAFHNADKVDSFQNFAYINAHGTAFVCIAGRLGRIVIQCDVVTYADTSNFTISEGDTQLATIPLATGQNLLYVVQLHPQTPPSTTPQVNYIGLTCETGPFAFYSCQVTPLASP
jgi:hypothetical protein